MIESELKKRGLTDTITRWATHTKVLSSLRDHDIPSLVGQVMEEFYRIRLCCGHLVRDLDEGVYIAFEDYIVDRSDMEEGGGIGEVSGLYCKDCAEEYIKNLGAWKVKEV